MTDISEIDIPAPPMSSGGSSALPSLKTSSSEDFLDPDNLCGQNLLRLTARGSSIVAELLRLSTNIPDSLLGPTKTKDPEQLKYAPVLFDFQYLRAAEDYEKKLNDNVELLDMDQEYQENHEEILIRFYKLFESIWKYWSDLSRYIEDVKSGVYIQHSLTDIIHNVNGKQLMCEALYLYGVMLLMMEEKIPGTIREKSTMEIICVQNVLVLLQINSYSAEFTSAAP